MITNTSNGATLELTQNLHQQVAIPVQSIQAIGKALTQQNISDFLEKNNFKLIGDYEARKLRKTRKSRKHNEY